MINELLKDHDRDTEFIVIASLRYCMGRRSYAPSLVTDWVMRHWHQFSDNLKATLRDDVRSELDMWGRVNGSLGDDCDIVVWGQFLSWIESN